MVSTDVASIPDSLRTISIIWLEASTSTKRAPSTGNSFYRNLNDRLLDVMWQQKLLKEMVEQVKRQISNEKDVAKDEIRKGESHHLTINKSTKIIYHL